MSQARTGAWWRQAHNDLELSELVRGNGFHAQACFFATQAAEKALKGAILELGGEPPHTHVLGQLVKLLAAEGLDVEALAPLPLPALSRMSVTSRYPLDDTPPSELFDDRDIAADAAPAGGGVGGGARTPAPSGRSLCFPCQSPIAAMAQSHRVIGGPGRSAEPLPVIGEGWITSLWVVNPPPSQSTRCR